jgi:hypothetical protein
MSPDGRRRGEAQDGKYPQAAAPGGATRGTDVVEGERVALIVVPSGLEGVIAFNTSIAEPDRAGGSLRYRGVDIEELVGNVPFEKVWSLLVDGRYEPGLPPAEPHPLAVRSGDPRVDLQAALAMLGPEWGLGQLIDVSGCSRCSTTSI